MKRLIFGGLLICLLVLSSSFLATAKAAVHTSAQPGVQTTLTPHPISLARLKALVRQTLGQQAVDHMGHLVTQPLATHAPTSVSLSFHQAGTAPTSHLQANTPEYFYTSSTEAGYGVNAEGVSWVQGGAGYFNVARPALPAQVFDTEIGVTNSNQSAQIIVGVDQTDLAAYLYFNGWFSERLFSVSANDQMDAEIYLDGNTNQWLVFIEDLTTRRAFGQEFGYTTSIVQAAWVTYTYTGGPVRPTNPITFTSARWVSNWDGWQPITSSAAAYYIHQILQAPKGG